MDRAAPWRPRLLGAAIFCAVASVAAPATAIQGGTVTQSHPYSVALCQGPEPGSCLRTCTGTLIGPNAVLTSRHCVFDSPDRSIDCERDQFGGLRAPVDQFWVTTKPSTGQSGGNWHRGQRVIATPGRGFCGRDIAVLVLADSVPPAETFPAAPSSRLPQDLATFGTSIVSVGYGATSPVTTDWGIRRSLPSDVRCVPGERGLECVSEGNLGASRNEFITDRGLCFGDSGAAAFVASELDNGRPLVLGVVSRALEVGETCEYGILTRTDRWIGFLSYAVRVASEQGGVAGPTWYSEENETSFPRGENGARCFEDGACKSGQCASPNGEADFFCAPLCGGTAASCTSGFRCATAADGSAHCFANERLPSVADTGGCQVSKTQTSPRSGRAASSAALLGLAGAVAALVRRMGLRRSRICETLRAR